MAFEDESLYAVIGIPVIFILGLLGVVLPSLTAKLFPKYGITQKYYFSFFNGCAAGIILAVGLIHSLPDAEDSFAEVLTEDSQVDQYPWAQFIALISIVILFTVEEVLEFLAVRFGIEGFDAHGHELHRIGSPAEADEENPQEPKKTDPKLEDDYIKPPPPLQMLLKMVVLFVGLMFHNVFIGLALGIGDNDYVLFIAILFHQFFEGLGMGSRVAMAKLKQVAWVLAIHLTFAAIPSVFIGIGIGIKHGVAEADSDSGYKITSGVFQACSAGILIYVAVMHMLRSYKDAGTSVQRLHWHKLFSYCGLLIGMAIMCVIGIWA